MGAARTHVESIHVERKRVLRVLETSAGEMMLDLTGSRALRCAPDGVAEEPA